MASTVVVLDDISVRGRQAHSWMKLPGSRTTIAAMERACGSPFGQALAGFAVMICAWRPSVMAFGWKGTPSLPTSYQTADTAVGEVDGVDDAVPIGALLIATSGVAAEEPTPSKRATCQSRG